MPVVTITLMEGYDDATKRAMATRLTDAVRATIAAPLDGITVNLYEVDRASGYMRGRVSREPGAPLPDAETVVRDFLAHMEARELDKAMALMADGCTMTFPGTEPMAGIDEVLDWARDRYTRVGKEIERIDAAPGEDGVTVYVFGTLKGEWLDGRAFDGIRFIDRFVVRDGLITDQRVWNDMGETMLRESRLAAAAE
jgi:phenylpyruvate tautomerase PptA (4-oxalocrotonate tautomerase family)